MTTAPFTERIAPTVGAVLMIIAGAFSITLGLIVPPAVVAGFLAVWVVVAIVGYRLRRRARWVPLAIPLAYAALAWAIVGVGAALFDWTA